MPRNSALWSLEANAYKKANLAICITDENGLYVSVNDKYAELFGYEADELLGASFLMVIPKDDAEQVKAMYAEAIKNPLFESSAVVCRINKRGDVIHVNTTYRVMVEEGKSYMIVPLKI